MGSRPLLSKPPGLQKLNMRREHLLRRSLHCRTCLFQATTPPPSMTMEAYGILISTILSTASAEADIRVVVRWVGLSLETLSGLQGTGVSLWVVGFGCAEEVQIIQCHKTEVPFCVGDCVWYCLGGLGLPWMPFSIQISGFT